MITMIMMIIYFVLRYWQFGLHSASTKEIFPKNFSLKIRLWKGLFKDLPYFFMDKKAQNKTTASTNKILVTYIPGFENVCSTYTSSLVDGKIMNAWQQWISRFKFHVNRVTAKRRCSYRNLSFLTLFHTSKQSTVTFCDEYIIVSVPYWLFPVCLRHLISLYQPLSSARLTHIDMAAGVLTPIFTPDCPSFRNLQPATYTW